MADYLTFGDIVTDVGRAIKQYQTTTDAQALIKSVINQVYLQEILQADKLYPLFWLLTLNDSRRSVASCSVTGITQASPGVVSADHDFVAGDIVTLYDIGGMIEAKNRTYKVGTVVAGTSFQLLDLTGASVDTSLYTAYTSGGTAVHRGISLASPVTKMVKGGVNWHGHSPMVEIDPVALEAGEDQDWWNSGTGLPERFMHYKQFAAAGTETDMMLWFPGAQQVDYLRYWAQKNVARLSASTDVPLIPWMFHDAITAGAVVRLGESQVQVENQVIWPTIYRNHLDAIVNYNRDWWEKQQALGKPYLL